MYEESNNEHESETDAYRLIVKLGDAVETPDAELWVVEEMNDTALALVSAYRGATDGLVYVDVYDATRTNVPVELVTKVADARQVRR